MDWHGLDMKDRTGRERWCEVWWVPCQILCPRDLSDGFLPFFLPFFSPAERARNPQAENIWFQIDQHGRLWLYHITVKAQTKAKFRLSFLLFYFETSGGGPNVRQWNITVICLELGKRTSLNHLIWCTSLSCFTTAVKWADQSFTHGWELCSNKLRMRCLNKFQIKHLLEFFCNFSLGPCSKKPRFNGKTVYSSWVGRMHTVVFHFIKLQMKWFTWEAWTCISSAGT